jgi:hypothetical protein
LSRLRWASEPIKVYSAGVELFSNRASLQSFQITVSIIVRGKFPKPKKLKTHTSPNKINVNEFSLETPSVSLGKASRTVKSLDPATAIALATRERFFLHHQKASVCRRPNKSCWKSIPTF